MMFNVITFGKLPIAFQALFAFVLVIFGMWMAVFATLWANGSNQLQLIFLSIAVLYLVTGVPSLIEGVMLMFRNKEPVKE